MTLRVPTWLWAVLWLASLLAAATAAWFYKPTGDEEIQRLRQQTEQLEMQNLELEAAKDSLAALDRVEIRYRDRIRVVEREATEAARVSADSMRDYLAGDSVGLALFAADERNDSLMVAWKDTLIASLERSLTLTGERLDLTEIQLANEHALRVRWQGLAEEYNRQLNPPFAVRATREGVDALAAFSVARYGFDVDPVDAALIAASIPLAKCLVKQVPLIGKAISPRCVFD